jgi:hypothetical protein
MKGGGWAALAGLVQPLLAVPRGKAHRAGGIDGDHNVALTQAVRVQHLLLQSRFHQPLLEARERRIGPPTQHAVYRIPMRQTQLEQLLVGPFELGCLALIVKRVARALLENKQCNPCHQDFAQCVVRLTSASLQLAQALQQVRENMRNGLEQLTDPRFPPALGATAEAALGLTRDALMWFLVTLALKVSVGALLHGASE